MQVYFGRKWDAPAFDDAREIMAPVGQACLFCEEKIEADDNGTMTNYVGPLGASAQPVHLECWLRQALGDVPHLEGRCLCSGGSDHDDRPYREASKAALEWVLAHGRGRFVDQCDGR